MSKTTPGPWFSHFDGHGGFCIENSVGSQIGFVSRGNAANARLIAAAPELLSALVDARKTLSSAIRANWEGATEKDVADHITIKVIDAAIARATGAQQ